MQVTQPAVDDSKYLLSHSEELSHSICSDTMVKKDNGNDVFTLKLDVDTTNALRKFGTNIQANDDYKQNDELGQDVDNAMNKDPKRYDSSMVIKEPYQSKE